MMTWLWVPGFVLMAQSPDAPFPVPIAPATQSAAAGGPSSPRPNPLQQQLSDAFRGGRWDEMSKILRSQGPKSAEMLRQLLDLLISDGYLVRQEGAVRFRSALLRRYWREVQG